MDRRLKIITIVISIVYVAGIGMRTYNTMPGFADGYNESKIQAEKGIMNVMSTNGKFILFLKPENGHFSFPTMMLNELDGTPMKAAINTMIVEITNPKETIVADICTVFLVFLGMFVMVMIPIQLFRVVRSITKNKIFDPTNIHKLRFIGYELLAFYAAKLIFNLIHYRISANVIRVEGYSLQVNWGNSSFVLLGLVVLIFAEVLKVSVQMKEEQDLTV